MKFIILTIVIMTSTMTYSQEIDSVSRLIIGMEKSALERWNGGDPSGYLEIYAKDIVYFDPWTEVRLDGLDKITELYEKIRGTVHVDKYNMTNPKVQSVDNMAILPFI